MLVKDLPLEELKPGLKFLTKTGKIATVARADSRPGHFEYYGSYSSNKASFDNDDHWFFYDIEGDDWWGHGMYHHHCEGTVLESRQVSKTG